MHQVPEPISEYTPEHFEVTPEAPRYLEEALAASAEGRLLDWTVNFLMQYENSKLLARKLRLTKRSLAGPEEIELDRLIRVCGPEPGMVWPEPAEMFQSRVNEITERIFNGHQSAPIMAGRSGSKLLVNDGTHTLEALKQLGYERYWVISWQLFRQPIRDRLGLESPSGQTTKAVKVARRWITR